MLKLQKVCKIYDKGNVCALHDVDLSIERGDYLSIVGASGSGKTTLMHILGCMDAPSSGRYLLRGVDVGGLGSDALARIRNREIGFVFQAFRLSHDMTALENAALPLLFRGVPKREREALAAEALRRVGLEGRMDHRPDMLSGGQQQRVAIARAVCAGPAVLLADEPTGNLDPASAAEVLELLDSLHESGHTIVLITHDRAVAHRAARRASIDNGRLTELTGGLS